MQFFLAKMVYRIYCGNGEHTPQFDEQLRLIEAADESVAFAKARTIGEKEQETFFNQQQQLVQWKFINVSELLSISSLTDGAELYSSIKETDNAETYIDIVNKKAYYISQDLSNNFLQLF